MLATFRSKPEGGEHEVTPEVYEHLNTVLAQTGLVDGMDVEAFMDEVMVPRLIETAHAAGLFVIASNHDFDKTPSYGHMYEVYRAEQVLGADVAKISYWPTSHKDVIDLFDATREFFENEAEIPLLAVSMSPLGVTSRLVGESFGSTATFGAAAKASAPGQVGVFDLDKVLDTVHNGL